MDFILNKLKSLHISGTSKNAPGSAATSSDFSGGSHPTHSVNETRDMEYDRMKSGPAMTEQQMAVSPKGNKSVSLNDILGGGPKVVHALEDNNCDENMFKIVEHGSIVSQAPAYDRGVELQPEINTLVLPTNPAIIAHNEQIAQPPAINLNLVNPRDSIERVLDTETQTSSVAPVEIKATNLTQTAAGDQLAQPQLVANILTKAAEIGNSQPAPLINQEAMMGIKIPAAEFKHQTGTKPHDRNKPQISDSFPHATFSIKSDVLKSSLSPVAPLSKGMGTETSESTKVEEQLLGENIPQLLNSLPPISSTASAQSTQEKSNKAHNDGLALVQQQMPTHLENRLIEDKSEVENVKPTKTDETPSLQILAREALHSGIKKINPEHGEQIDLTEVVDTDPTSPTWNSENTNISDALTRELYLQQLPETKSDLPVVCLETGVPTSNKIEMVKKNLLEMFDTLEPTRDNDPIAKINCNVNKLEVLVPTSVPQSINYSVDQTEAKIVNVAEVRKERDENDFSVSQLPVSEEFHKLNSEIKSNNDQINSTLEAVMLHQILNKEYASDKMPSTASMDGNGNKLETMILNQILEQNNSHSPIDEIKDRNNSDSQKTSAYQIADIDVNSADNFIEFVDEIIDFALRKVDFLKISYAENTQPLTPVPEEAEEASEAVKLNDYDDYSLFTPTIDRQNINFPTLESFEIEELQAKVMEQVDDLYLNETPIDQSLHSLSRVPESPKINELQAKAMEQANELNLSGTIAEFMYLHSAVNKTKPLAEPIEMNVNVESQRKLPPPIAIAAVVQPTSNNTDRAQNESFFLGDPPSSMFRSQSNYPQSPMETSQTKLSQSMNEVYFDKRLDITGKRSFRRDRDQKMMLKSKKDQINENLNRDKSQEPQRMLNKDTPRDSLEELNEPGVDLVAARDFNLNPSTSSADQHIEKQENEGPEEGIETKGNKMDRKESLKDSLENLVDAVEQDGGNAKRPDAEMEEQILDSLENLVEAIEAISEGMKLSENVDDKQIRSKSLPAEENSYTDKQCNCKAKNTSDITTAVDGLQQKGVQSDVKPPAAVESVIHNTTAIQNSVEVQSIETEPSVVLSKNLNSAKEPKDVTMSLDIMNSGGDKLDSNKYYESVSDEPKIKTDFIMAEYRKPVGNPNGDLEKIINEYESKEESLIRRLTEKEKTITKMTGVMEAYEKTIAEMIAEKEQLIMDYEKKCVNLKSDADLNAQHLLSLEDTFADLHAKYERSKQITIDLKTNEEGLRDGNMKNLELLNAQEIRYEKMKSHAIGQLQIANEKLEQLQRAHAQESTKLKALLKREELARSSLTEQLQQKIRENEELVKICEELIGKE